MLFADDLNMFVSGEDPDESITIMNKEIFNVFDWLRINKSSLNLEKTLSIFFKAPSKGKVPVKMAIIGGHF